MADENTQSDLRSPRRVMLRFVIGLVVLVFAAGIVAALVVTKPSPNLAPTGERALTVQTIVAQIRPVARSWRGYGTARALSVANVAAQVAGEVIDRPDTIDAGAWVDADDLLVQIDDAEFEDRLLGANEAIVALEAQLESLDVESASIGRNLELAEAGIALSERELVRATNALDRGAATQTEVDRLERELTVQRRIAVDLRQRRDLIPVRRLELEAQIRQLRAQARLAQLDVHRAHVTAPISGALQTVDANVGDWLSVGAPIARIVDLRRIEAPMRFPISAGADLRTGDHLELRADGPSGLTWDAEITRIAPEADAGNRTLTIFAVHEQPGGRLDTSTLMPGQFIVGTATSSTATERILIPRNAILNDRVAVVSSEGRVVTKRIEVAFYLDREFPDIDPIATEWAALASGVEPGDRIITSNLDDLEEGLQVTPAADSASAPSTAQRTTSFLTPTGSVAP